MGSHQLLAFVSCRSDRIPDSELGACTCSVGGAGTQQMARVPERHGSYELIVRFEYGSCLSSWLWSALRANGSCLDIVCFNVWSALRASGEPSYDLVDCCVWTNMRPPHCTCKPKSIILPRSPTLSTIFVHQESWAMAGSRQRSTVSLVHDGLLHI